MSFDVQLFAQCNHIVTGNYYGNYVQPTPQRTIPAGTLLYQFDGRWTQELPASSPNVLYVPVVSSPVGTVQYFLDGTWQDSLPQSGVSNGLSYTFVLANDMSEFEFSYYYAPPGLPLDWYNEPPVSATTSYVPVVPRSQTITQYYYDDVWSDEFPTLTLNTVYVPSAQFEANLTMYNYNGSYQLTPPQSIAYVPTLITTFGSQEYYYQQPGATTAQWTTIAPASINGTIYVYTQSVNGQVAQYFYNAGWSNVAPSGFTLIPSRMLLSQSLLYYYDGQLQLTPPSVINAPMLIFQAELDGLTQYQYDANYSGGWNETPPNVTNEVYVIENPNYPQASGTVFAYYYNNAFNLSQPLVLPPAVEVDVLIDPSGTLGFSYNGQLNPYPPTQLIVTQQRVLTQPINQYYYNNSWQDVPVPPEANVAVIYLPTQVVANDQVQYYYNNDWQVSPAYVFDATQCPRCAGLGFYYDVSFTAAGQPYLASGATKLAQEVLKILVDELGGDPFHPNWGNGVRERLLGHKNTQYVRSRLQLLTNQTLTYLQSVQQANQALWHNMDPTEIIANINYVNVTVLSPTGYQVDISITNQAGTVVVHSLQV